MNDEILKQRLLNDIVLLRAQSAGTMMAAILPEYVDSSGEGSWVAEYRILPSMKNRSGVLHGGLTAAIFDNAFGILARCMMDNAEVVTVNLNVSYAQPVHIGDLLRVQARVESVGRCLAFLSGTAGSTVDGTSAAATATIYALRAEES